MKKLAMVLLLAIFVPSLVLAWLAVRSLRDQQFILERQQSLFYQGVADSLAKQAENLLSDRQHEFGAQVESMIEGHKGTQIALGFDNQLRTNWRLAEVGFVVMLNTAGCELVCPSPVARPETRTFCANNGTFLANRESAEIYWNPK